MEKLVQSLDWDTIFGVHKTFKFGIGEGSEVIPGLKRNYKLMWLDKAVLPQDVIEGTIDELKRGISLPMKTITLDRVKIIEGTNWVSAQNAPSQFDPFKDFS